MEKVVTKLKTFLSRFKFLLSLRQWGLLGGSALVIVYIHLTDPIGASTIPALLGELALPILAVWFAYAMRKVIIPYMKMEDLLKKAKETSVGSAITFLGGCIIVYGLLGLFGGRLNNVNAATIPQQAYTHIVTLKETQVKIWPDHPFLTCSQA